MKPAPVFRRSETLCSRGALWLLFGLLAAVLCCAEGPSPSAASSARQRPIEREIHGGETHVYPFELQTGQFLRVVVEENGADLALRLLDPSGALVIGADFPGTNAPGTEYADDVEDLAVVAAMPGPHRLEVTASGAGSGRYVLKVEGPRTPSPMDQARADAVRVTWDALTSDATAENRIGLLERALTSWREVGDGEQSAEVQFRLGRLRVKVWGIEQALADFRQAAETWNEEPGRRSKGFHAESLTWIGRCLRKSERPQEARAAHEQALILARDSGEAVLETENLNLIGRLYLEEGELREALNWQLQALEKARAAGDRTQESMILNNLTFTYEKLDELQRSLEYSHQALELALETADRTTEMIFLNNLGDTYRSLGNWEKALPYFQRAAEMTGASGDRILEGYLLINLATVYRHQGQLDEARSSLDRALALGRQIPHRELQIFALDQIAFLLLHLKQPVPAEANAREAVSLGGSLEAQDLSRYALGNALLDLGDTTSARTELMKALDLARRRGDRGREAELDLVLARMNRDGGDLVAALSRIRSAIELIETRRGRLIDKELRTSLLASKQDYYELEVDTLMALQATRPGEGFAADAMGVSEQARARGLLEILSEAGADIRQGLDATLAAKEQEARREVNTRDWQRRTLLAAETPDREKLAEAERKVSEAIEQYQKVQVELREGSPRYAALTLPQPLSMEEIQHQVLEGDALLLEYALGAKRSFLWAVARDSFASFELPGRDKIETAARRYYELLTVRNGRRPGELLPAWKKRIAEADVQAEGAGRELARLILGPAEPLLGDRPLLIVADGALQYIPFAALPITATGAPLATHHVIVNLPSASVLAVLRGELRDRPRAGKTLAIFADPVFQADDDRLSHGPGTPDQTSSAKPPGTQRGGGLDENREKGIDLSTLRRLIFSQREADAIAAQVPPDQVFKAVGFAASRAVVASSRLENYQNVHFATHGVLDSQYPDLSGLVLSLFNERGERVDGVLRLNDIYNLRLGADLVVLSACRTALGKEIRGEGIVGLTRGFMYAGAARVLASLWSVEDRATAELMESFYRGMLRDGLSPATALRKAQLEMAKKPSWKSPYYWAGFSLQGEWR